MDDERVLHREQDLFLVLDVVDLFQSNHFSDRQHFEREVFSRRSMPRQHDTPERSRSLTKQTASISVAIWGGRGEDAQNTFFNKNCAKFLFSAPWSESSTV